eukprot:scaffold24294_cov113-Phaeocystis_antarctica.AAC.2
MFANKRTGGAAASGKKKQAKYTGSLSSRRQSHATLVARTAWPTSLFMCKGTLVGSAGGGRGWPGTPCWTAGTIHSAHALNRRPTYHPIHHLRTWLPPRPRVVAPARVLSVPDAQVARARMRGEALEGVHARGLKNDAWRRQQLRCDRLRQLLVRQKQRQTVPVIAQLLLFLCTVSDEHRCLRFARPEQQFHIAIGSQLNASFLLSLCRAHGPFDATIDDAAHMAAHIRRSLQVLFPDDRCMATPSSLSVCGGGLAHDDDAQLRRAGAVRIRRAVL